MFVPWSPEVYSTVTITQGVRKAACTWAVVVTSTLGTVILTLLPTKSGQGRRSRTHGNVADFRQGCPVPDH